MVTENGIELAVHLITNHFGNLVAKVCESLLRRGPLSLEQLIRFTELINERVKNSLLILIQHNCVQAFTLEQQGNVSERSTSTMQYMALFDNILHRLRFPKFLVMISKEVDKECLELFEGLLRDGRLSLKQMVDRASQREENPVGEHDIRERLLKLVAARYVERCPLPEPVVMLPAKEDSTTTKNKKTKSAKTSKAPETTEQLVLAAAIPMEALRFSVTTDSKSYVYNIGEKRKFDALAENMETKDAEQELTLWRANFEEFMHRLKHKACIENVRTRLDDGAAIVLSAILEATKGAENKVKMEKSVPLSLNDIFEAVMKSKDGLTMTLDRVRASLVQLGCSQRNPDDSYSIDLRNIIESARNEEVESVVLKRYGREAYRMFRLLLNADRFVETDKIADSTLVEKKDTPKILYKLWKDDYLHMEKLVINRLSSFLLWKVNKPVLWEHVLDELCHAALNLSLRLVYEKEQENELLNIPVDKRVGSLEKRHRRLRGVWLILESSLMKLDDALMVFHDF